MLTPSLPWQPEAGPDNPVGEDLAPHVQPNPSLMQLEAISLLVLLLGTLQTNHYLAPSALQGVTVCKVSSQEPKGY